MKALIAIVAWGIFIGMMVLIWNTNRRTKAIYTNYRHQIEILRKDSLKMHRWYNNAIQQSTDYKYEQ